MNSRCWSLRQAPYWQQKPQPTATFASGSHRLTSLSVLFYGPSKDLPENSARSHEMVSILARDELTCACSFIAVRTRSQLDLVVWNNIDACQPDMNVVPN
jgi:hypothetical protein